MNMMDEFRTNWLNLFTAAAEAKGWNVVSTNAASDASKLIADVESLIAQSPDVIVITAVDAAAALPAAEAVKAAGIPSLWLIFLSLVMSMV
jgi:ribose transport system substrate-binding protein